MASRLPIFHDDLTYQDRHERGFRDMKNRIDNDLHRTGFGSNFSKWNWEDDMDKLCGDFFQLKPRPTRRDDLMREQHDFGSRESLDDHTTKNVYLENPQTKGRTFHVSFDVKEYSPNDISVKTDGGTLKVEARHEDKVGDHTNVKEFSRSVKIPEDVDADKLSSTLSNDGILTITAPVPPKYTSVSYVNQSKPAVQNGAPTRSQPYQQPPQAYQHPQQSKAPNLQSPPPMMSAQPPPPQGPPSYQQYSQYSQPATQYVQQTSASSASPPPPPMPAQPSHQPTPPASKQQASWPAPPPPEASNPSVAHSPPPLFEQPAAPPLPIDKPVFRNGTNGGPREMELALEVPRPFTPDDIVVKLEGKSLHIEATHEEKAHGKTSKSSISRSFDLEEDLDPASVDAMLRSDGCLLIKGKALTKP